MTMINDGAKEAFPTATASILDFVSQIQLQPQFRDRISLRQLDLSKYLSVFPLPKAEIAVNRVALDRQGTELWNWCRRLEWTGTELEQSDHANIRALAFFMIESAQDPKCKPIPESTRSVRLGLATAKLCLRCRQAEVALRVLERIAIHVEDPLKPGLFGRLTDDRDPLVLRVQYIGLRMVLAWQQEKLDLAEHFFGMLDVSQLNDIPAAAEYLIELMYQIGNFLLGQRCLDAANLWFERAHRLLQSQNIDQLSSESGELKLNLLHAYARALHRSEALESLLKAEDILQLLLKDYGNRLVVRLLQLHFISDMEAPNPELYYAALNVVASTVHLTEQNLCMIMHFVHQLGRYSTKLACQTLNQLLLERLLPHGNDEWITKNLITLLWMSTTGPSAVILPSELSRLLTKTYTIRKRALDPQATAVALVLLWKRIENSFDNGLFTDTIAWCKLGLHELLQKKGHTSSNKIERKLAHCYFEISNLEACKTHVDRLLETTHSDPLNHYLAYRLALKIHDDDLAQKALSALEGLGSDAERILYACISKALESDDVEQAAHTLLTLLDRSDFNPSEKISLPALLRCTIRAHTAQLPPESRADPSLIDTIARLFAAVPEALERQKTNCPTRADRSDSGNFSASEMKWFVANCYNLAVQKAVDWPLSTVLKLFDVVIKMLSYLETPNEASEKHDVFNNHARKCQCYFAIAILHVAEARKCSVLADQVASYRDALRSATGFNDTYVMVEDVVSDLDANGKRSSGYAATLGDLTTKRLTLSPLEFEAALCHHVNTRYIGATPSDIQPLSAIVTRSRALFAKPKAYALLADCVLSKTCPRSAGSLDTGKSLPLHAASLLLIQIIAAVRTLPNYDTVRASRWIRCMVQLCLDQDQLQRQRHRKLQHASSTNHSESTISDLTNHDPLKIVQDIVAQGIALARQTLHDRDATRKDPGEADTTGPLLYPAEELEWLSTTLFNVGIDFFVHDKSENNTTTTTTTDEEAKNWTSPALEIAHLLAAYPPTGPASAGGDGGDGGLLVSVLKRRMRDGLGWLV